MWPPGRQLNIPNFQINTIISSDVPINELFVKDTSHDTKDEMRTLMDDLNIQHGSVSLAGKVFSADLKLALKFGIVFCSVYRKMHLLLFSPETKKYLLLTEHCPDWGRCNRQSTKIGKSSNKFSSHSKTS